MRTKVLALLLALCALPAFTQTPIDFSQALVGFDHKPIMLPQSSDPKAPLETITLFNVSVHALIGNIDSLDGRSPDPVTALKRERLAGFIYDHQKAALLSAEEIALIEGRIKVMYANSPGIDGPALRALDLVGYEKAVGK